MMRTLHLPHWMCSVKPLTICLHVGAVLAVLTFAAVLVAGILGEIAPFTCVAGCLAALMGGALFLTLSLLGVYVGRVYEEAQGRPLYIVQERIGPEDRED